MSKFYGAKYNLEQKIQTHLFVISPNNSGSTFLKNALATSEKTWNLSHEGQHLHGFVGPSPSSEGHPLIWAAKPQLLSMLSDSSRYNWPTSKKAWYFQAFSKNKEATVFVEKSPTSLIRVEDLQYNFHNSKFIFLVRNPYAVVEGIYRRYKNKLMHDTFELAATHIMNCFQYQRDNIQQYKDISMFCHYEEMCAQPEVVEEKIKSLVPALEDISLEQKIPVKGIYDEMLRDMNKQQLERLEPNDFKKINNIFIKHKDLLEYFDYQLLEKSSDAS